MILFLRKKSAEERATVASAVAAGTLSPAKLAAEMEAAGVFAECRACFQKEIDAARAAVAAFADDFGAKQLLALADVVVAQVDGFFASRA